MNSLIILIGAGLLVPLFFKGKIVIAKYIATAAFAFAAFNVFMGHGISMEYFTLTPDIQLLEIVVLIVLAATMMTFSGFERPLVSQTLFLGAASMAMLETNNFLMFIVLFEVIAIISYVLGANIRSRLNAEGAIKMFVAGATASGFILLGFALFAMVTPSFNYAEIAIRGNFTLVAVGIMLAGIFYKMTIVPMHGWAGDAYAQINHSAAAILSSVIKVVVVIATFKAFYIFLQAYLNTTVLLFSFFAIITMTLGNFMALFQKKIAKILSFSSIAHAGYMLIPFAAIASGYSYTALVYLAVAYIFMQTSVFLLLNDLRREAHIKTLDDIRGLYQRSPLHALFFTIQLLSLAGVPIMAGFISKAVTFWAGVDAGLWPLVLIAALNSALSVGYYAWVIKHIYFDTTDGYNTSKIYMTPGSLLGQLILLAGTIYFGIFAAPVFVSTGI
ncbi:MAG: NADH-quinone oxidoreductase subunit N [Epsilonproteobacteria bacterium]|nr:NADH-quinone oxidoreductase subunit N [Campylobacterota bacterium]